MSETETLATNSANGPSLDDAPFVPSGPPLPRPAGEVFKTNAVSLYRLKANWIDRSGRPLLGMLTP